MESICCSYQLENDEIAWRIFFKIFEFRVIVAHTFKIFNSYSVAILQVLYQN